VSATLERVPLTRRRPGDPGGVRARAGAQSAAMLVSFALLAGYGILRWQTMLPASMFLRCIGLLVLALAVVALASFVEQEHAPRPSLALAAGFAIAVIALAMIPMSGFPLNWFVHVRVAVTARAIGHGIAALPNVTVPYSGHDRAIRAVTALGAGLLLLSSALMFVSSQRPLSERRLAGAALPLLVLAILPSILGRPRLVYLHGAVLFVLLMAFVFGARLVSRRAAAATTMVAATAVAGLLIAVLVNPGRAWVNFSQLVNTFGHAQPISFNWAQTYGPLVTPSTPTTVLDVHARFPAYWKAENLDTFNGVGWIEGAALPGIELGVQSAVSDVRAANLARWGQTLRVSLRDMRTRDVIAAGSADEPLLQRRVSDLFPAASPGTWTVEHPLSSGASYSVDVYTPKPSAARLAVDGDAYRFAGLAHDLTIALPSAVQGGPPSEIQFGAYGSEHPIAAGTAQTLFAAKTMLMDSPYREVYDLAQSLKAGTRTPFEFVRAVDRYLQQGYKYVKNPPRSRYPIVGFLFHSRRGYCQQFAGAMALLLRMGGVPARVAVGFATGTYDRRSHEYVVTDQDAHAWVEVWFPSYGWVTFDPTPPATINPVGGASGAAEHVSTLKESGSSSSLSQQQPQGGGAVSSTPVAHGGAGSGAPSPLLVVALVLVIVPLTMFVGLSAIRRRGRRRGSARPDELLAELEAAFARCGEPIRTGETLSQLEQRVSMTDPAAGEYVARLRGARYGGVERLPTHAQRRAIRACLAVGRGTAGRFRALLALPPRRLH
jgi:protein-glutamine gamma-glutamyltransferase